MVVVVQKSSLTDTRESAGVEVHSGSAATSGAHTSALYPPYTYIMAVSPNNHIHLEASTLTFQPLKFDQTTRDAF